MRYACLVLLVVAQRVYSADVTPNGVNSLVTGLDGAGVLIGQAEVFRSSKADYDDDDMSASNTKPAGVYFSTDSGMADPNEHILVLQR